MINIIKDNLYKQKQTPKIFLFLVFCLLLLLIVVILWKYNSTTLPVELMPEEEIKKKLAKAKGTPLIRNIIKACNTI